ncbi:MAG: hypothetical protein SPJ89_10675 [Treponema sp.]|nr:hypothetical protein [Spirochaetia bacterium]MDD7459119.1 hypothetical protein [Spirochaetales bacterium]MDY5812430.1 hypothetical protein [Treponema sp.]
MDFNSILKLSLSVLKDWRIIFIAIFSITFMMISSYVVKYRKKPPRPKKQKVQKAPAAEPKPEQTEAKKEG